MQRADLKPGTVFCVVAMGDCYTFKCLQRGLLGGTQKIMTLEQLKEAPDGTSIVDGNAEFISKSDEGIWYILL